MLIEMSLISFSCAWVKHHHRQCREAFMSSSDWSNPICSHTRWVQRIRASQKIYIIVLSVKESVFFSWERSQSYYLVVKQAVLLDLDLIEVTATRWATFFERIVYWTHLFGACVGGGVFVKMFSALAHLQRFALAEGQPFRHLTSQSPQV